MTPRTPEQWSAIVPNEADVQLHDDALDGYMGPPYRGSVVLAAASRIDAEERCVAALAFHLFDGSESMSVAQDEARRILGLEDR